MIFSTHLQHNYVYLSPFKLLVFDYCSFCNYCHFANKFSHNFIAVASEYTVGNVRVLMEKDEALY